MIRPLRLAATVAAGAAALACIAAPPSPAISGAASSVAAVPRIADSTPADSTPADFSPADFSPADFTPADFTPADFTPADFSPADFSPGESTSALPRSQSLSWEPGSDQNYSCPFVAGPDYVEGGGGNSPGRPGQRPRVHGVWRRAHHLAG